MNVEDLECFLMDNLSLVKDNITKERLQKKAQIYKNKEASLYSEAVREFLKDNPEFDRKSGEEND